MENHDPLIEILPVDGSAQNFYPAFLFSQYSDLRAQQDNVTVVITPDIDLSTLQEGILPNQTITLSGEGKVLIPRITCTGYLYACLVVTPGFGSTFRLLDDSLQHQSCIQASGFLNCQGQ